jgi:hypothetical protein
MKFRTEAFQWHVFLNSSWNKLKQERPGNFNEDYKNTYDHQKNTHWILENVKLSLRLINQVSRQNSVWACGRLEALRPLFLKTQLRYPLYRGLGGPRILSNFYGEEKHFSLPMNLTLYFGRPACSPVAISASTLNISITKCVRKYGIRSSAQ